jgi:hypothetical protein
MISISIYKEGAVSFSMCVLSTCCFDKAAGTCFFGIKSVRVTECERERVKVSVVCSGSSMTTQVYNTDT